MRRNAEYIRHRTTRTDIERLIKKLGLVPAPDYWLFVNPADLLAPEIDTVVLPVAQTQVFIRTTVIVNLQ